MKRTLTLLLLALICTTLSACQSEPVDLSPLPSVPPDPSSYGAYICDDGDVGIPAPVATANVCEVYNDNNPTQRVVLGIYLADVGEEWKEYVFDKRLRAGGTPMPELLPDAIGVYWAGPTADLGPVRAWRFSP